MRTSGVADVVVGIHPNDHLRRPFDGREAAQRVCSVARGDQAAPERRVAAAATTCSINSSHPIKNALCAPLRLHATEDGIALGLRNVECVR